MSRTTPALTDKYVVTIGPKCHVACLDAATGELHWFIDLVKDHGAKVPAWYAGQCPLIENGKVILGVGGDALITAVDIETGEVPISLAFSDLGNELYAADGKSGEITVVDVGKLEIRKRIQSKPGLGPMRFSQDERWGLVVNPIENEVST